MAALATVYEMMLGAVLLFVPWTRVWQENYVIWSAGALRPWLLSGPARGVVSGLGAAFLIGAAGRILQIVVEDDDPPGPAPALPEAREDARAQNPS